MKVSEFLHTIGCVNRDRVYISLTEGMTPRAEGTLHDYERADKFRAFDERRVGMISPSSGSGRLFLLITLLPDRMEVERG